MAVRTRKGRAAVTIYRVIKRLGGLTLLQLQPQTGRTHQIRVHLSAIGHPVMGDKVYGGRRERKAPGDRHQEAGGRRQEATAERHLLHAWKLGFFHPRTDAWMEFEAQLPADFAKWLASEPPPGNTPLGSPPASGSSGHLASRTSYAALFTVSAPSRSG